MSKKSKKPYSELEDDIKLQKNWNKAVGLFARGEYSVSIIRCGTCLEILTNFVIRHEMIHEHKLPSKFVDRLLKDANGLGNKFQKLYIPIIEDDAIVDVIEIKRYWNTQIKFVNQERNKIVHSGEFKNKATAEEVLHNTLQTIEGILEYYRHNAVFKEI